MKNVVLETDNASSIEDFHSYLKDAFEFPDCYGGNLDSLYDCLTGISECITVTVPSSFDGMLDGYGERIARVFKDAADCNDYLHLRIEDKNNQNI